jgi:glycosyltransferase involved in cell wall biosynthesis
MRVLFVTPGSTDAASARYRCGHLAEALTLRGHDADVVSVSETATIRVRHDVVVLHRIGHDAGGERLIAAARSIGAVVVYGADDLIFEPEYAYQVGLAHPDDPARYHYHRAESEDARRCLLAADAVLLSTDFLAARARHALAGIESDPKPVTVLRNFLSLEMLRLSAEAQARRPIGLAAFVPPTADDRVTVGYLSGSPTHDADLADIAPALAGAMERCPGARLLVVGPVTLPPSLEKISVAGRVRRHPFVPWRDLPGLLAGIDLNLAPLDSTRIFNHAKSEVKFLEAGAVGVPTLAGAATGFEEGVRAGADCAVARRAVDWADALEQLLTDSVRRAALGAAAQSAVLARGSVDALADSVVATFTTFAALVPQGAQGEAPARQPFVERFERRLRAVEESSLRRLIRFSRHLRLLDH